MNWKKIVIWLPLILLAVGLVWYMVERQKKDVNPDASNETDPANGNGTEKA